MMEMILGRLRIYIYTTAGCGVKVLSNVFYFVFEKVGKLLREL